MYLTMINLTAGQRLHCTQFHPLIFLLPEQPLIDLIAYSS